MKLVLSFLVLLMVAGCTGPRTERPIHTATIPGEIVQPPKTCKFLDKGLASWYGHELAGNHTANGELFNPDGISAAHRTLPFGTVVKVMLDNGKGNPDGVYVRINDRGPFVRGRIIDLSWGAAKKLGMMDTKKVHIYRCS